MCKIAHMHIAFMGDMDSTIVELLKQVLSWLGLRPMLLSHVTGLPILYLKVEHGISCNSFKALMYQNDTDLFAEFQNKIK